MIGLALGVLVALITSKLGWSGFVIDWIDPFGQIFIRLLKVIAVPLVLFSILKGVTGLTDMSQLGRMGAKTFGFYIVTTVIAAAIGLILVNTIQPGNKLSASEKRSLQSNVENFQGKVGTEKVKQKQKDAKELKSGSPLRFFVDLVPQNIFHALGDNVRMLQVIFFAIFLGIGLSLIPKTQAKPVLQLIDGLNEAVIKLIEIVMKAAPFFVFCLMAGILAKMAQDKPELLGSILEGLAWFAMTVLIGLGTLALVVYPLIQKNLSKKVYIQRVFSKNKSCSALCIFY